jgi:hypothetical protein
VPVEAWKSMPVWAAGGPEGTAGLVAGGDVRAGDRCDEGVEPLALGGAGGAHLGLALRLGLRGGLGPGDLLGQRFVGGLLLGGGLGVDLLGDGVADGDDGVRPVCSAAGSAANAGAAARVPTTPVVARAATLAARTVVRWVRLGRRCFPVARVNAMKWLVLSFLLAYRVS